MWIVKNAYTYFKNMLYFLYKWSYNSLYVYSLNIHTYKFHIFQAEVYVNLLEGETVDESSSSLVEFPSINELPAKNASEKTDLPPHTQQQLQQNSIISSPIISNPVQSQSMTNNIINNAAAHFGNNLDQ